jgi:hypothetical protein
MKKQASNTPTNTTTTPKPEQTILDRFLAKLEHADNGCLEYQGGKLSTGYGVFHVPGKGSQLAHRFAYESYHEVTLKSDQYVRHLCNNPSCSSPFPGHLAIGSAKDNSADMVAAKRSLKGRKKPVKRFTTDEKAQIIKLASSGKSLYSIAKKFDRAVSTISQVLTPKRKPKPPAPQEQHAKAV